jgi:uroporphyrin-III C-methyltransferase
MEIKKGKVILAGAGPGDAELITVKLQRRLAEADVILSDRLVNPAIIELFANKEAEVILSGKQGYNEASYTQDKISALIVKYALEGKTVLRLKGGDVAFFSNVLDELIAIEQNNIEFEIIPGITAASGASAYTGIPLTARGYAQGVEFLTYNPNSSYSPEAWRQFATCNDTLVFYMAAKNVTGLAEILLRFTKKPNTPLALIEQATTEHQLIHITTLKQCEIDFKEKQFSSPSLVIIGDVVNLHQRFNWLQETKEKGTVFNELVNYK